MSAACQSTAASARLLLTDRDLWRNAIFDFPERMTVQRMNGEFADYDVSFKMDAKTWNSPAAMTKMPNPVWRLSSLRPTN